MKEAWPPEATDEERSLRLFKDALMKRGMAAFGALLFPESEEELRRRTAEVEHAYARVREHTPAELKGDTAPTYAEVLIALTAVFAKVDPRVGGGFGRGSRIVGQLLSTEGINTSEYRCQEERRGA